MVYSFIFDILFCMHSSIILGTIGSYQLFSNVTVQIALTHYPYDTLSLIPGKVLVQMYSNLE